MKGADMQDMGHCATGGRKLIEKISMINSANADKVEVYAVYANHPENDAVPEDFMIMKRGGGKLTINDTRAISFDDIVSDEVLLEILRRRFEGRIASHKAGAGDSIACNRIVSALYALRSQAETAE